VKNSSRVIRLKFVDDTPDASLRSGQAESEVDAAGSLQLAKRWLDDCLNEHDGCKASQAAIMPTRVLEVGEKGSEWVRLIVPARGSQEPFVALSYCWGGFDGLKADMDSVTRLMDGFAISELPQTIRDAARATQGLGFKYLWVDSFCILQGASKEAREDWMRESALMEQVYSNAIITITAAASSSSDQGIFYPRTCTMPCVRAESSGIERRNSTLIINEPSRLYKDEPIHARAWVLQERLLSRRVLSYCFGNLSWHCDQGMRWESPVDTNNLHTTHKLRIRKTPATLARWELLVMEYSSRSLTESKDKLSAVGALARKYHSVTGDEYLAGLWKSRLPEALLWLRSTIGHIYLHRASHRFPETYRAPSWSWASMDCNVWFLQYSQFVAQVVDCQVQQVSEDPFGMLSAGELVVEASYLEGIMDGDDEHCRIVLMSQPDVELAKAWPDERGRTIRPDTDPSELWHVICILICKAPFHYSLVLRPSVSQPEKFVRVGMASSTIAAFWAQDDRKLFAII
jgi:hypothetical protein